MKVECFEGVVVDYGKEKEGKVILGGVRGVREFEYEMEGR